MDSPPRFPPNGQQHRLRELCLLGVLAFVLSIGMARYVFQWQTVTGDEGSYLFQANCFRDGLLKRECPVFHSLLPYDMIILRPAAGWVSRYPPGHPLWLLPGVLLGLPQLMSALAASVTVMCAYAVGIRLRFPRFLLPFLLLVSPFFLFMHGTLLSHTSGLATVSVMFLAYLVWRQDRKTVWALVAGLAWAFYFTNRTWTALLIAIPFGVDCLYQLNRNRRNLALWLGTLLFAGGAVVGIAVYMMYNKAVTGDAGTPTYLFYEASEGLGFGPRRTQGGAGYRVEHTFLRGVQFLGRNLRLMDSWMLGAPLTLLAWVVLMVHGWSRRWSLLLLSACLMVCAGYVYFWYPGVTEVGPVYYTELLLFVMILGASGLSRIWRRAAASPRRRGLVFAVMALLVICASALFSVSEAGNLKQQLKERVAFARIMQDLPDGALVFREPTGDRYLDHYLGLNARGLDSDPLILKSRSRNDALIASHFPEREAWTLSRVDGQFRLRPLPRKEAPLKLSAAKMHCDRSVGGEDDGERVAREGAAPGLLAYGWYTYLAAGRYELQFDMQWSDVDGETPLVIELAADQGREIVAQASLSDPLAPTSLRFELKELAEVEPRVRYGGSGSVRLRSIELRPSDQHVVSETKEGSR